MNYQKIIRASAIYDLVITTPFMFPPIAIGIIGTANQFAEAIGLRSDMTITQDTLIWISLMATVVTLWSILRVISPERRFGLYDGFGRLSFSFWFLFYPLVYGTSELSYLFLGPELIWGAVQLSGYWKINYKSLLRFKYT
uniref:Uncharacterized protein n=1 Tax=OCS116 cluster bacterium TaxID=2030921 RepID=A0A2A4YRI3_9PROT